MAKTKTISANTFRAKPKKSRKRIHAKTKSSKSKSATNYIKLSRGQG